MWTDAARRDECMRRPRRWLVALVLLASGAVAHALSTDSEQPISIMADRAEHDDATRMTIYRGNVVIDQGSLHITGDTVTINFDAHDEVTKITTLGAPAHFRQLPDGDTGYRKAWARQMEYFPQQDLINLSGEARYEKDGSRVQADRLVYDSLNARFRALSDAAAPSSGTGASAAGQKPERVRIQIKPKKKPTQEESGASPPAESTRTTPRWPFSPRADSRNGTATVSSSTTSASRCAAGRSSGCWDRTERARRRAST